MQMKTNRLCSVRSFILVMVLSAIITPPHHILISYPVLPNISVAVLYVMTACVLYPADRGSMFRRNVATAPHVHIIT